MQFLYTVASPAQLPWPMHRRIIRVFSMQVVRRRELQLVQNQHLLRDPDVKLFAEALEQS